MKKTKYLLMLIIIGITLFILPNISNATVEAEKVVYANNGSAKFNFTGLSLDTAHEYEFGLTKTSASSVSNWHLITVYTDTTATIDITAGTEEFTDIIVATETGYITIKDKTTDTIVLQPYPVDLSIPYLNLTNYTIINNGKDLSDDNINICFWNAANSKAYYQYVKITDQNIIDKYKEIKNKNGDYNDLQPLLSKKAPVTNWKKWDYWNGSGNTTTNGFGYPEKIVDVPESGLYYMWIYLAGNNIRNEYGYILVDNLDSEIELDKITLPKVKDVALGETLTLIPTYSPANTTNRTVTWSSSDESVATVDKNGKITPLKLGSTIITVTSKDGNKKATCTVTVVEKTDGDNKKENSNSKPDNTIKVDDEDDTKAPGKIPQTGINMTIIFSIILVIIISIVLYKKYNNLRDVK